MSDEEKVEEQKKIGANSALPKITQAGYSSLDVSEVFKQDFNLNIVLNNYI